MNEHEHENEMTLKAKIFAVIGILAYILAIVLSNYEFSKYIYIVSYIFMAYDICINAIKHLFSKDMFDENLIMTAATVGAMILGDYNEAIAVMLLYKIGEFLNDKAVDSSKDKIEKVLDLRVNKTTLKNGKQVDTNQVKIGDIILVNKGDKVPVDCILLSSNAEFDMSALNGESTYIQKNMKEEVLAGTINVGAAIELEVIREEKDSAVSKIIELVENANERKSKTESYISRFCKIYTPVVILIAILIPFVLNVELKEGIYRALNFLVISCPCALVISVPLGFFVGMGVASKRGILAKGTTYLDRLSDVSTMFLDKTGTLTTGNFKVESVETTSNYSKEEVLEMVAIAEHKSSHVIAKSIVEKYGKDIDDSRMVVHEEISGYGIKATIDDKKVICGNHKLLLNNNIKFEKNLNSDTIVYLAVDNEYKGYIILADDIKENVKKLTEKLHKRGVKQVIMLTGDREASAKKVVNEIATDSVYYELLPQDKVRIIEDSKKQNNVVAFVGDGINDSPVIASSDVGIAMGKGSDIAIETADIVLMTDEPEKIVEAIDISKLTKKIVNENIAVILLVKIIFLICSVLGITTMWLAVFADVGITILSILNSLRIFSYKPKKY